MATTSTPARKPFVRTHYVRTNNNDLYVFQTLLFIREGLHNHIWRAPYLERTWRNLQGNEKDIEKVENEHFLLIA